MSTVDMRRDEAIRILQEHESELRGRGVVHLSVFGSVARNEAKDTSDVDILADFDPAIGLFAIGGIQYQLEEILGCPVDLSTSRWLKPRVSETAIREAILVF